MTESTLWKRFEQQGVWWALAVGLLARLVFITVFFHWNAEPVTSDDATYVRFAHTVLETGTLPTHHFPIGYPLFLVPFLALGSFAFPAVRLAHVAFGLVTIATVGRIGKSLYGPRAGVIAALLTALYPPLVFMTGRIMSETVFIMLLVLSIEQFLTADRERSPKHAAYAGALLALGSLARSNLVVMMPFLPLWLLLGKNGTLRTRVTQAAACVAVAGAILITPGFYFLATQGHFIPLATNGGQTFYGANNALADGGWVEVNDHPELLESIPPEVRRDPRAFSKAQQALAVKWIKEHPGDFLALLPKKLGNAWVPGFQRSETTSKSKVAELVLVFSLGLLLVGAAIGRLKYAPRARDGMLLAVLGTYTVLSLAFYGNPRIGLFCSPVLIVYCAALLSALSLRAAPVPVSASST